MAAAKTVRVDVEVNTTLFDRAVLIAEARVFMARNQPDSYRVDLVRRLVQALEEK